MIDNDMTAIQTVTIGTAFCCRYRSSGLSERDFVESVVCHFRATAYVARTDTGLPGKANLYNPDHLLESTVFVDRIGNLGSVLKVAPERAKAGQSLAFNIPVDIHKTANIVVKMALLPVAMAPLSLLSDRPTLERMMQYNAKIVGDHGSSARKELMGTLSTLEMFNHITMWTEGIFSVHSYNEPTSSLHEPRTSSLSASSRQKEECAHSDQSRLQAEESQSHPSGLRLAKRGQSRASPPADVHGGSSKLGQDRQHSTSSTSASTAQTDVAARIAGLKKMGFSDATIAKVMSTIPSQGVATTSTTSPSDTLTPASASPAQTDVAARIAGLKKMGFSDAAIAKIMSPVPSQGVAPSTNGLGRDEGVAK